jgi:hypothetical protein
MKKLLAVIVLLISWPALLIAGPTLTMPETHWDYGNVPQHSVLTHDYWIKNTGDDTLKIIQVKPG